MNTLKQAAAIILAAGSSSRMGGIKKEYQKINDSASSLTVLGMSVIAFAAVKVQNIVIAVPENGEDEAREALPSDLLASGDVKIFFVTGGKTRRASVLNSLSALAPDKPDYVLIHDGARPWVSPSLIENIIEAAKEHGAVIPLLPLTDTPKECEAPFKESESPVIIKTHLKRANTGLAQTPQAFKFPEILHAHQKAAEAEEDFTDDAEIWGRYYGEVAAIPGSPVNKKITYLEDLIITAENTEEDKI